MKKWKQETRTILAGLDIGSTKIAAVIGEWHPEEGLIVLGVGMNSPHGWKQGLVIDLDLAVDSVRKAVEEAQLTAGMEVKELAVSIVGDHIRGINSRGVVAVSGPNREITQNDVNRVLEAASAVYLPRDREVIEVIQQEYIVDSQTGIRNPIGISGIRLEAEVHLVTGSTSVMDGVAKAIEKAGFEVSRIVLGPLASGAAVLDAHEYELGVVLVDIGGMSTDVAVFFDGVVRHSGVIRLGSQHVTNDIAVGLKTSVEQAEDIKKTYGSAHASALPEEPSFFVSDIGGHTTTEMSCETLRRIVQPRMEEILSLVLEEIRRADSAKKVGAGIVLTGGGALLRGIVPLAEEMLEMSVRLGIPKGFSGLTELASSPVFSTAVGLLFVELRSGEYSSPQMSRFGGQKRKNWWEWLQHFWKNYF